MQQNLNELDRGNLALLVMDILSDWRLEPQQQLALLGLPRRGGVRQLTRYRHGTAFPDDEALLERAKHILGIQEALHVVFAQNPNMPSFWLRNRNRYFRDAPLNVMLDQGLSGMSWVWRHLDCTQNWD